MLRTGSVHFEPLVNATLVIDAQTGQPCNYVSLQQIFEANYTLAFLLGQYVLVVTEAGLSQAHHQVTLDVVRHHELGAHRALDTIDGPHVTR